LHATFTKAALLLRSNFMEQSRLFIAIGISFLIFFLWSMLFAPKPTEKPVQVAHQETAAQSDQIQNNTRQSLPAVAEVEKPIETVVEKQPVRRITVDTPLFRMVLSSRGATVTSAVLKAYHESIDKDSGLKELIHAAAKDGTILSSLSGNEAQGLDSAVFSTDFSGDALKVNGQGGAIRFQHRLASGLIVEKVYKFVPDSYLVGLTVKIHNGGDKPYKGSLALELDNALAKDSGRYAFEGPSGLIENKLEQVNVKKLKDHSLFSGQIQWVAIEDRYFMTSIIPPAGANGQMKLTTTDNTVKNQVVIDLGEIPPNQNKSLDYKLFMGPKSVSLLKTFDCHLDRAVNFGWFDFLAKPCLWFMNFIYRFIPNYGVAIILLTILSRGIFWPLAKKSYTSMGAMRKLQPLMQEIREKYKDDKARVNQETMALYRTYKVNPMGGCLPMVIQLPVFFALYRMLYSAIELRHAPFFGWINDLSAPERLFQLGFKIPFMQPPYGIPVMTLIMGATMLIQQKMSPQTGDPSQAKMMMLMPVIFTFIFINFSSGLVLYWLVSNLFSIAQQYHTQKQMA
jgi:YidC/Oxa1 family membrane protein insertase